MAVAESALIVPPDRHVILPQENVSRLVYLTARVKVAGILMDVEESALIVLPDRRATLPQTHVNRRVHLTARVRFVEILMAVEENVPVALLDRNVMSEPEDVSRYAHLTARVRFVEILMDAEESAPVVLHIKRVIYRMESVYPVNLIVQISNVALLMAVGEHVKTVLWGINVLMENVASTTAREKRADNLIHVVEYVQPDVLLVRCVTVVITKHGAVVLPIVMVNHVEILMVVEESVKVVPPVKCVIRTENANLFPFVYQIALVVKSVEIQMAVVEHVQAVHLNITVPVQHVSVILCALINNAVPTGAVVLVDLADII